MKFIKPVLWIVGGLLVLLIVAAIALVVLVNPNDYKAQIVQAVKDKQQRTLTLDGNLSLTLFPRVGIALGKTLLSEHRSEKIFARIESAEVSVAVLPLLRKQVQISRIALDGLEATFTRDKEGHTNLDDLISKPPGDDKKTVEASAAKEGAGAVAIDIEGIRITRSQLHVRDAMTDTVASLREIDLDSGRIADKTPSRMALRAKLVGEKPKGQAELVLETRFEFDAAAQAVRTEKLSLSINGAFDKQALKATLEAALLDFNASQNTLALKDVKLDASGQMGDLVLTKATLSAPQLSVTPQQAQGDDVKGEVVLAGKQPLEMKFLLSGISGNSDALKIAKLTLDAKTQYGARNIVKKVTTPINASLTRKTIELPTLQADAEVSGGGQKAVQMHTTGSLRVDAGKEPLAIRFDLAADTLNLDLLLPPESPTQPVATQQAAKNAEGSGKPVGEVPIDLSVLKNLDLAGQLRIAQLQVHGLKASAVSATLKAAGGQLDAAPLSAKLYDGSLSGSAQVNAHRNSYVLKQTLSNVNINPLLVDVAKKDVLEGRGNVVLDVTTNGNTVTALKKALGGNASVMLRDGALKGINLAKSLRDFKAKIGKSSETQSANRSEKTDFSEMSASFKIANGVAHNDDLAVKSPFLRAGGNGNIDIGNSRIDYLLKATLVNTSTGQGGKDMSQVKDLTVPVHLTGPLDQMSYQIDWGSVSSDALKGALKPKLEEKKQELREKLLKGLFK
ncbi:MAG: AsmA family protein [Burkholderiaceae bacterium]|nr:MAG: AsmA family protein [Burkholderiaceae bacterium]